MQNKEEGSSFKIMETELGILAPAGHFYFINREQIEEYTPGLLAKVSLEQILKSAQAWLHSNAMIALLIFTVCTFTSVHVAISVAAALAGYAFWYFRKNVFIHPSTTWLAQLMSSNILVYLGAGVLFSYLGMNELYTPLTAGLILFFLVKPPIFKYALATIRAKRSGNNFVSEEDSVLNTILIRYALAQGITTQSVQEMEDRLFELIHYNRTRKK